MARFCPPGSCVVCRGQASLQALCASCQTRLSDPPRELLPEHVVCHEAAAGEAVLVDVWGRPHPIGVSATVGREGSISILSGWVSRHHAEIHKRRGRWQLRDLESRNGTFVNQARVTDTVALRHGDHIRIARPCFLFAISQPESAALAPLHASTWTAFEYRLCRLVLSLRESPKRNGGTLVVGDKAIELSTAQFALMKMLADAWEQSRLSGSVGASFVASHHLLAELPWDTDTPMESSIKSLVRRLRRNIEPMGLRIDSEHGLGYRLEAQRD